MPRAGQAELAGAGGALRGLVRDAVGEGGPVGERVGVGRDERRRPRRGAAAAAIARPAVGERGGRERERDDPAGVLRRRGEPEAEAREQVVARRPSRRTPADPHSERHTPNEHRHVVERELRVGDREERDREQRRARAGRRGGRRASRRRARAARPRAHRAPRSRRAPAATPPTRGAIAAAPAVGDVEEDQQQVGEGRRVAPVAGLERALACAIVTARLTKWSASSTL